MNPLIISILSGYAIAGIAYFIRIEVRISKISNDICWIKKMLSKDTTSEKSTEKTEK